MSLKLMHEIKFLKRKHRQHCLVDEWATNLVGADRVYKHPPSVRTHHHHRSIQSLNTIKNTTNDDMNILTIDNERTGNSAAGLNSSRNLSACRSHTFTFPSWSPDISSASLGCRTTELTAEPQSNLREVVFVRGSQTRTVPSSAHE